MPEKRFDLLQKYNSINRPLILNGAMGSLLQQKGFLSDKFLWYSIFSIAVPELILSFHKDYIEAGAEIITTNTFKTNPTAVNRSNYCIDAAVLVEKSVQIAIEAREGKEILIAGSNAPAEDCYQTERTISKYDLEYNHKKHIELLWVNGCNIIWNETHSHWDEIEIICKFCSQNELPFVINLFFSDELKLLSGEPLHELVEFINDFSPQGIGFNCIKPDVFKKCYNNFLLPFRWGFYFNCGAGSVTDEFISCGIAPDDYIKIIDPYLTMKPLFVGSCCGSSPKHTFAIKEYFNELYRN